MEILNTEKFYYLPEQLEIFSFVHAVIYILCVCFCLLDCFVSWLFNGLEVDITRILVLLSYFKKWLFIRKSDHDLILLSFLQ